MAITIATLLLWGSVCVGGSAPTKGRGSAKEHGNPAFQAENNMVLAQIVQRIVTSAIPNNDERYPWRHSYPHCLGDFQLKQNGQWICQGFMDLFFWFLWCPSKGSRGILVKIAYAFATWYLPFQFCRIQNPSAKVIDLERNTQTWFRPLVRSSLILEGFTILILGKSPSHTPPPKFNIAPEKYLPNRKVVFQPPFFRGYVKLRRCNFFLQKKQFS